MKQNTIKDYLSTIGEKGGNTTKKRHGKKHFSDIAKKRWSLQQHKIEKKSSGNVDNFS